MLLVVWEGASSGGGDAMMVVGMVECCGMVWWMWGWLQGVKGVWEGVAMVWWMWGVKGDLAPGGFGQLVVSGGKYCCMVPGS